MNKLEKREQRQHEMFELITKQQTSGLSQIEFCQQKKVSIATFGYWRKKYLDHQQNDIAASPKLDNNLRKEKFLPLQINPSLPKITDSLEIQLPNQIIVRCSSWSIYQLSEVIRELQKVNHIT